VIEFVGATYPSSHLVAELGMSVLIPLGKDIFTVDAQGFIPVRPAIRRAWGSHGLEDFGIAGDQIVGPDADERA
jgi:hypothetical protein